MHQLPPETLAAVGKGFKFLLRHGAQPGQDCPLPCVKAVERCGGEQLPNLRRYIVQPAVPRKHPLPKGGGGGILPVRFGGVIAAGTVDGENIHGGGLLQNGFAVFHPQNIVGVDEGWKPHSLQRLLPGGREGQTRIQRLPEQGRKRRVEKAPGGIHKQLRFRRFRAEAQHIA